MLSIILMLLLFFVIGLALSAIKFLGIILIGGGLIYLGIKVLKSLF